jgi:O-phospho-L-seryl-tRNASec:L-selenocysteinyl-tRNA synthase
MLWHGVQVEAVARLCAQHDVPHVVNHAYGVQSSALCAHVSRACRVGRVDVIIQSTDKNFLVPVGGSVVAAPQGRPPSVLRAMACKYPGRASVVAHLDLVLTLLHLGRHEWLRLLQDREALFVYLQVHWRSCFQHCRLEQAIVECVVGAAGSQS